MKRRYLVCLAFSFLALSFFQFEMVNAEDPQNVSDARLEAILKTVYVFSPHLNPLGLRIDVSNGVATLRGEVESSIEKDLAVEMARVIDGIHEVDDQLTVVNSTAERDFRDLGFLRQVKDSNLTASIRKKLLWNKNIQDAGIAVKAKDGAVTLTGQVVSDSQKKLAELLALSTPGVSSVTNKLKVLEGKLTSPSAENPSSQSKSANDHWTNNRVKSTLLFSSEAIGSALSVETKDGVTTVSGTFKNAAQHDAVMEIIGNVDGVREVIDKTTVANPVDWIPQLKDWFEQ